MKSSRISTFSGVLRIVVLHPDRTHFSIVEAIPCSTDLTLHRGTVQTGCSFSLIPVQSIHLHEKNIVGPTERSEDANASSKLAGQDRRFSMKMMLAPDLNQSYSPSELLSCPQVEIVEELDSLASGAALRVTESPVREATRHFIFIGPDHSRAESRGYGVLKWIFSGLRFRTAFVAPYEHHDMAARTVLIDPECTVVQRRDSSPHTSAADTPRSARGTS